MEGFLLTHKGMEDIASLEVKELIGKLSEKLEKCVVFDIKNHEDLFKLCYLSQSAYGVYFLLKKFDYTDLLEDLNENAKDIKFGEWLSKKASFRVRCKNSREEERPTPEIEAKIGAIIIKHIEEKGGYKQSVDLENPDLSIAVYFNGKECCIGVDFAGFDLSKRGYKIFSGPSSLKGTLAYMLVRLSSYEKKESLLDCFAGSGMIPIEAALFASKFPVNFYNKDKFAFLKIGKYGKYDFKKLFKKLDSKISGGSLSINCVDPVMKYLQFAKKNSKIAGVGKKINFSRMDIEWLDTKFKKNTIDKIAAKLPESQKKELNKAYKEFFYQAEFILSKEGKMAVTGNKELIRKYAQDYSFSILQEKEAYSGDKKYDVFVLEKKK